MTRAARLQTLEDLTSRAPGGTATLGPGVDRTPALESAYKASITALQKFPFWRAAETGTYRPETGLWLPQRKAVALAQAYLCAQSLTPPAPGDEREAALVKMPTGTGKSGVIATLACASPRASKTLILTPRAALVRQLARDLSYRFWRHFGSVYHEGRIHGGLSPAEIEALQHRIERGTLSPVRLLNAEQYRAIYAERGHERQILVGTFNALHLILGIRPPAHRSMYGRTPREPARSIRAREDGEDDQPALAAENVEEFRAFLKSFDLVIVDEGHYEPAYSWSQTVAAIGAPTLIFTATPYRNDYKYFKIKGNFVFNLSWQEAAEHKLIRHVRVEPARVPKGAAPLLPSRTKRYDARQFVREFRHTLERLPRGKKVIVHGATFTRLKRLQVEFYKICNEAAVLIHDRAGGHPSDDPDLGKPSSHMNRTLSALRFQHVRQTEKHAAAQASRVWLHQYKLLEGIDESRFTEVWLCDAFGSARQVVQQIGRAIRLPDPQDPDGQTAIIRGSQQRLDVYEGAPTVAQQLEKRWSAYLQFEEYASRKSETAFTAETQLLAMLKRTAPDVQYILREFRLGHLLDERPPMEAFVLPRRGTVCRIDRVTAAVEPASRARLLDRLQQASIEAMQLEERFDIRPVAPPADPLLADCRLIQYLAWNTSPYLLHHHLPEWRLGVMAIVCAGRYVFLLDTEGICLDTSRVGLLNPEPLELKRLFASNHADGSTGAAATRIVETSAIGLDISELGVRSITLRKHALDEGYFDLAEASQVPTTIRGYGGLADGTARRRLSISRGSVADPTSQYVAVRDYVAWARDVAAIMMNESIAPHAYFQRFANDVPPLEEDEAAPQSILLDVWEILDPAADQNEERLWNADTVNTILGYDTCCDVITDEDPDGNRPPRYFFEFGKYKVDIRYVHRDTIPPSGRYTISCDELNEDISADAPDSGGQAPDEADERAFGRKLSVSLTRLINQEQSFRIVPQEHGVVYSHAHFFKPDLDRSLLNILEECAAMDRVVSEKGETELTNSREWATRTLFGLVHTWGAQAPSSLSGIAHDVAACPLIVCDDRGQEAVDFFGVDEERRRVYLIHAKARNGTPDVSARKLQEVVRQAQASLAFAGSNRREFPLPDAWQEPWSTLLKKAGGVKKKLPRLFKSPPRVTVADAHHRLTAALADATFAREVVVLTAGLLSKQAALTAFDRGEGRTQNELQFLYFLASVRTTFDRAGVRLRLVTNP